MIPENILDLDLQIGDKCLTLSDYGIDYVDRYAVSEQEIFSPDRKRTHRYFKATGEVWHFPTEQQAVRFIEEHELPYVGPDAQGKQLLTRHQAVERALQSLDCEPDPWTVEQIEAKYGLKPNGRF